MADYTREWKYRAWHPVEKKMYSPEDLEEPDTGEDDPKTIYGQLIDGELKIYDIKSNPPVELVAMQSTNWYDNKQYEVFEGDIVEIDNDVYQVIWDEEMSGYILLNIENDDASPGGDYLGDSMKLLGNVFENGDADPDERRRSIKFRAWDPDSNIMYYPEDIKDPQTDMTMSLYAYLSFGALYIYDLKNDPPMELIPMQFTGWKDCMGKEIFEGDLFVIGDHEEVIQVVWSDEVGQFVFLTSDGTLMPGNSTTAEQLTVIGNQYENPESVPQL